MTDAIVIGGGLAGCATAYYLAADGVDVLLLEQGDLNSGASGNNAGSLHAQLQHEPYLEFGEPWARAYIPALRFFAASIELWQRAAATLGADLEVALDGGLLVAADAAQMRRIEAKAEVERAAGLPIELLGTADLRRIAPYISQRMIGAAFCPIEGKANPLAAGPAFAAGAAAHGARIATGQRVAAIERGASGFTVTTATGQAYEARRVVNAAGINAGRIAQLLGATIDIQAFAMQLSVSEPAAPLIKHLVYCVSDRFTAKQTKQGGILIGGGWPALIDERGRAQVSAQSLARNLAVALDVVPALAAIRIVRTWAAVVNGTHDWIPVLGELPGVPGFFLNYVPWMGFTGAPAAGRIIASLVQGKLPPLDLDLLPFQP
ncbi:MAG TPA: FAD-dependent oxidoreductase [Steroidobacteraceae bacterium]|nr:FAD-dependent oxidoreductase [Steroidobacteraceae bacterium]